MLAAALRERTDDWHERVLRALDPVPKLGHVVETDVGLERDPLGGDTGDHPDLGLRRRQRRLRGQPGLDHRAGVERLPHASAAEQVPEQFAVERRRHPHHSPPLRTITSPVM